jgi:acyl-coenzyme A synthetase/AMP-(fatty) acid ligase
LNDVIKSRETKIYPAAVEQVLMTHPAVADACVYGVRDGSGLERVHAAVTLRGGATCTAGQLRSHVAGWLTPLHAPVRLVRHAELPLTEAGKVDRRRLQRVDWSTPAMDDA